MIKTPKTITIVGAGTAGLVAALMLRVRFHNIGIKIVRSKKIGIIGVGEGSTEHWNEFLEFVGINFLEIVAECDATFKCGILFRNWGTQDYMHNLGGDDLSIRVRGAPVAFLKYISEKQPNKIFNSLECWENKLFSASLNPDFPPYNQYHFNTFKLNAFLERKCLERNIDIVDDEILEVNVDEKNIITKLIGESSTYTSDFYIDCTGFSRILMSKLGAKWQSYSDCLKVNSAITFQTPVEEEFNIYTLAHAKNAGWMFRIPVWDRYGNGYIYDSNFITKEQAAQEMFEHFGKEIEIGREFKFDPGSLKQVWISNCCAIGLSSSFFEPLEATSIGSSILQTFCLMDMLVNYDERTITEYNKHINDLFLNIRDFVFLHYLGGRNDTDFWKYVSTIKIPESLQYNLEKWENKIPIQLDFDGTSHYRMFNSGNFTQILYGLNKFNVDSIKKQFDYIPDLLTVAAKHKLQEKLLKNELMPKIGHKEYITALRTIYSKKKRMEAESHYF